MSLLKIIPLLAAVAGLVGCSSSTLDQSPAEAGSPALAIVPGEALGVRARPGEGCLGPAYRQFDFWLGNWDVYADTTFVGTNQVERELGGCVVEENWIDPSGSRGRSLNVYDRSTGRWSQMWVGSNGGLGAYVLLEGGLIGDTMHVEGSKFTPGGFEIFNTINWVALPGGVVEQFGDLRLGSGPLNRTFDIFYRPVASVTPLPEVLRPVCTSRPPNREFDFALGTWRIQRSADVGGPSEGTATYSTDLSGCLFEERIQGTNGYQGWSFNTWHSITQKWHRMFVDNRGLRLVTEGGLTGGAMVMRGTQRVGPTTVDVRVSWTPRAGGLVQRWELSTDGGVTWRPNAVNYLFRIN